MVQVVTILHYMGEGFFFSDGSSELNVESAY